jgi:Uncharacterized protein conserved in bacteria
MKKRQLIGWCLGFSMVASSYFAVAAPFEPSGSAAVEISADEMDYNWKTGNVSATGNVVALQKGDRLQGDRLEYNMDTQSGALIGNVVANRVDGSTLVTSRLDLSGGSTYTGSGGVNYTSPANSVQAPWLQYDSSSGYIRTEGRTTIRRAEGTMKADQIEAWEKSGQMIGRGNVDFNSPAHSAMGRAERVDYTKNNPNSQGHIVLTGNAHLVYQGDNMLTGPKITMDLDTGYAQAEGRPTLVITPQQKKEPEAGK